MAETKVSISGLRELDAALKDLAPKIEGNILRGGLRAGTTVFRDRARALVPTASGDLKKSIRVRTRLRRGEVSATLTAGDKTAWYAHLLEFGTGSFYEGSGKSSVRGPYVIAAQNEDGSQSKDVGRANDAMAREANGRGGKGALLINGRLFEKVVHPGIHAQPFMRPAFDGGERAAVEAMADYIRARLAKELAK